MIQIEALHFKYVGRKAETLAGIELYIEAGETVLLLGPSGSGKSSLALTLNGLIPHTIGGRMQGRVRVADLDSRETPISELTQQVGILFQDPEAQFVTMTVEDELVFGLENLCIPPAEMDDRLEEALEQVALVAHRQRGLDALSGGEKQRLALAALLAMRPRVLIFDEPTANLDPVGTQQVFETINRLKQTEQYTILIIEHKLDPLMHLLDRVIVLTADGKILMDGSPQHIFGQQADRLVKEGIWMPQTALLAHQLQSQGITLTPFPMTIAQAEQALLEANLTLRPNRHPQPRPAPAETGPPTAIEVRNLSFYYGESATLKQINLRVPQGDFLALVGANGAGKTTLAKHLINVLSPPKGSVWLAGDDLTHIPSRQLIRRVGYVFQNPEHQFITNAVAHEIGFGLRLMGLSEADIESRTATLLTQFGLAHLAKANPFTLSHGEKRRLSVATMLAMGQEILILDEPTFGQDQRNATALMQLLQELHATGCTIIIITHDMNLVAEYARHTAVMAAGELLFHGPTAAAFAQPDLLAEARLTLPPLGSLSERLARHQPEWADLQTAAQFVDALAVAPQQEARPL